MKLINKKFCQYINEKLNWKEAIAIAAEPLIKKNKIKKNWINEVWKNTEEIGPYYIITQDLAFPHISPSDLIIELGTSFAVFKNPVTFYRKNGEELRVHYILCLASKDGESHMNLLQEMVQHWNNKKFLEDLKKISSLEELNIFAENY